MAKLTADQFTKLQKQWYLKLKQAGFRDIECGDYTLDKPFAIRSKPNAQTISLNAEYYGYCREFYFVNEWQNSNYYAVLNKTYVKLQEKADKTGYLTKKQLFLAEKLSNLSAECWKLYSDGMSYRDIAKHKNIDLAKVFNLLKIIKSDMKQWLAETETERHQLPPDITNI